MELEEEKDMSLMTADGVVAAAAGLAVAMEAPETMAELARLADREAALAYRVEVPGGRTEAATFPAQAKAASALEAEACRALEDLRARDSLPGADGLPYAAWLAAGETGAEALEAGADWMASGGVMDPSFNIVFQCFAPKSSEGPCDGGVRDPKELRPLGLKNTDNKLIASVFTWSLATVLSHGASRLQNGFVPGRQLLQNPVDLDARARAFGLACFAVL